MKVMGIIFANDGSLDGLTEHRTTASVPFGGRYRQVDFSLSNLAAAGVRHIGIISRHHYQSLINHIGAGEEWGLELEEGGLEFLTPYAMSATDSYRGKLESLYTAMAFLTYGTEDEYVIMTGSSILCNIDMKDVLASHIASGKDITVVTKAGIANGSKTLDLAIKLDSKGEVADIAVDYAAPEGYLATMDIFVTTKKWLAEKVREHIARNRFHMDRDLVLGQWLNGDVSINVRGKLQGVGAFTHRINHSLKGVYTLALQSVHHHEEDLREHLCVVGRSVVVELVQLIVLGYDVELMLFKLGVNVS